MGSMVVDAQRTPGCMGWPSPRPTRFSQELCAAMPAPNKETKVCATRPDWRREGLSVSISAHLGGACGASCRWWQRSGRPSSRPGSCEGMATWDGRGALRLVANLTVSDRRAHHLPRSQLHLPLGARRQADRQAAGSPVGWPESPSCLSCPSLHVVLGPSCWSHRRRWRRRCDVLFRCCLLVFAVLLLLLMGPWGLAAIRLDLRSGSMDCPAVSVPLVGSHKGTLLILVAAQGPTRP